MVIANPCTREVHSLARSLSRLKPSRAAGLYGLKAFVEAVTAAAAMLVAALAGLNPLALLLLGALIGAITATSIRLKRTKYREEEQTALEPGIELLAHKLTQLLKCHCSGCRQTIPGFKCRSLRLGATTITVLEHPIG
jgi:hypothetical protein